MVLRLRFKPCTEALNNGQKPINLKGEYMNQENILKRLRVGSLDQMLNHFYREVYTNHRVTGSKSLNGKLSLIQIRKS